MIGKRSDEAKAATLSEVKELLEARAAQPDFGYEQQTSLDYSKKFAKLDSKKALALVASLMEIEGMKHDAAVKIADIMPSRPLQYGAIFAKDKVTLSDSAMKKAVELVNSYR